MITGRRNSSSPGLTPAPATAVGARPPASPTCGNDSGYSQIWRAELTPSGPGTLLIHGATRATRATPRLRSIWENSGRVRPTAIFSLQARGHRDSGLQTL